MGGELRHPRRAVRHARPAGSPCRNCGAPLDGPFCHDCGQASDDFHRSIWRLGAEAVGDFFDIDNRLWRTLPRLAFAPGSLTLEYLDGHRASQTPPLRIFLVSVVIVFLAGSFNIAQPGGLSVQSERRGPPDGEASISLVPTPGSWFERAAERAAARPEETLASAGEWAQRLAVLALPIAALSLGLLFVFRPGVTMFQHIVFSMHSLSFQTLVIAVALTTAPFFAPMDLVRVLGPIHLFAHMRAVYGTGIIGTLLRMFGLFLLSVVGFVAVMALLILLSVAEVGGAA